MSLCLWSPVLNDKEGRICKIFRDFWNLDTLIQPQNEFQNLKVALEHFMKFELYTQILQMLGGRGHRVSTAWNNEESGYLFFTTTFIMFTTTANIYK